MPPLPPMGVPMRDPIGEQLFPPDFVLENSQAINLSETQKISVQSAVLDAQQQFTKLQWRIQDEMQSLARLLKPTKVDSSAVMAQLNKELDLERQMKRTQLGLMIRIKNLLTADQQAKLQQLKPKLHVFGPILIPPQMHP
jgi:Spy/CpxP family protein refolding chaperone